MDSQALDDEWLGNFEAWLDETEWRLVEGPPLIMLPKAIAYGSVVF